MNTDNESLAKLAMAVLGFHSLFCSLSVLLTDAPTIPKMCFSRACGCVPLPSKRECADEMQLRSETGGLPLSPRWAAIIASVLIQGGRRGQRQGAVGDVTPEGGIGVAEAGTTSRARGCMVPLKLGKQETHPSLDPLKDAALLTPGLTPGDPDSASGLQHRRG